MEFRSKAEHIVLFSGITLAVLKCLSEDKLKNFGPPSVKPYMVAIVFILCIAALTKLLYHLQFTYFVNKHIGRDHGLFCLILLPTALIFSCINCKTQLSNEYKMVTIIISGLALSSIMILCLYKLRQKYFQSVISAIATITIVTNGMLYLIGVHYAQLPFLSILSQCLFFLLLNTVSKSFLKCFTIGEFNLVCQGIVTFLISAYFHFSTLVRRDEKIDVPAVNSMIFIALTGFLIVLLLLHIFPLLQSTLYFYIVCIGLAGISILAAMGVTFNQNPLVWFLNFISATKPRIQLMIYFIICSILTFMFIALFEHSSTVIRKFFHGVVIMVYIPAFIFDTELLLLASSLIFGIFCLLECIRVLNIFPLGNIIQNAFNVFLDEKDSGVLILTHLYLFLGCSVPLWIHPYDSTHNDFHVCVTSGILALGFGDSTASIVGTYFGKHKWPHTKKTVEGTLGAFVIQSFGTLVIFLLLKQIPNSLLLFNLTFVLIATAHCVLLETFTTQVDNLVLPFFLYIMFVCL